MAEIVARKRRVYYSPRQGRHFLTLRGAVSAEARAMIKQRHHTVSFEAETGDSFHWRDLPRSEVLLRRVMRLIKVRQEPTP